MYNERETIKSEMGTIIIKTTCLPGTQAAVLVPQILEHMLSFRYKKLSQCRHLG